MCSWLRHDSLPLDHISGSWTRTIKVFHTTVISERYARHTCTLTFTTVPAWKLCINYRLLTGVETQEQIKFTLNRKECYTVSCRHTQSSTSMPYIVAWTRHGICCAANPCWLHRCVHEKQFNTCHTTRDTSWTIQAIHFNQPTCGSTSTTSLSLYCLDTMIRCSP